MPRLLTCPIGHQWESDDAGRCPLCASIEAFADGDDPFTSRDAVADELPPPPALGSHFRPTLPGFPDAVRPSSPRGTPAVAGYEILGELGRGGMGVVYKARHLRLNRLVALKMIRGGEFAEARDFDRFRTEAEAVARLQHPNIVQIFEVGEADRLPYLALELVEGESLARKLAAGPLPALPAAALVETLARAMQHVHEQGVVHRDLKPGNVLFRDEGREENGDKREEITQKQGRRPSPLAPLVPKIADFGLAKRIDGAARTTTGALLGTPSYMAPEQAAGLAKRVGPAADTYALGAILYETLTGRPPFLAPTSIETLRQVLGEEVVPPTRFQPVLPRDLETICLKCLEKEPRKRYASARELADDLRRFLAGEPIQARAVGRVERAWRWCGRNRAVAALIAAAVFLLLAGSAASTYFAVQSGVHAGDADRNANQAKINEGHANDARQAAEQTLVEGLLLPLGRKDDHPTPAEIEALEKLAAQPEDRVRVLFIETALAKPRTARQLAVRPDEAVHAAVGLSVERRRRVAEILLARLRAGDTPAEVRQACVLAAAALQAPDPDLAGAAIKAALDLPSPYKDGRRDERLIEAVQSLAPYLHPGDAATAVAAVREKLARLPRDQALLLLAVLSQRLPPDEAASTAADVVQRLRRQWADPTSDYSDKPFWPVAAALCRRLSPDDARDVVRDLVEGLASELVLSKAKEDQLRTLLVLLPLLPVQDRVAPATRCFDIVEKRLNDYGSDPIGDAYGAHALLTLAPCLPDRARRAAAVARRLVERIKTEIRTNAPERPWDPGDAIALVDQLQAARESLGAEDATRTAESLLEILRGPPLFADHFDALTTALAAYADALTPAMAAEVAGILRKRRAEAGDAQQVAEQEALSLSASAAFADHLPPEDVKDLLTRLHDLVPECSARRELQFSTATARGLAALAARLPDAEARAMAETVSVALVADLGSRTPRLETPSQRLQSEHGRDALRRLLPLLTRESLIDLLKTPTGVQVVRGPVLEELGRREQRTFPTMWDFVDWAQGQEWAPELSMPLRQRDS